jgi:glycosyltransferase involved in cell wall biosynthesis
MSAGIIPVVLNRGGVTDIVRHGLTGFLAADAEAIARTTLEVYQLPDREREALRRAAISWVERFSSKAFARNFHVLANRGVLTKPFRFLQQQTMGGWRRAGGCVSGLGWG